MFEILENLNVLHSRIGSERDHSEVTIFKANLENYILFKHFNLILKVYNAFLAQSHFLYVYSNFLVCLLILGVFFENLDRTNYSIISIKSRSSGNNFQMLVLFEYFLICDLLSCSILYITRKGVEK
jgi:hypothetical protein